MYQPPPRPQARYNQHRDELTVHAWLSSWIGKNSRFPPFINLRPKHQHGPTLPFPGEASQPLYRYCAGNQNPRGTSTAPILVTATLLSASLDGGRSGLGSGSIAFFAVAPFPAPLSVAPNKPSETFFGAL